MEKKSERKKDRKNVSKFTEFWRMQCPNIAQQYIGFDRAIANTPRLGRGNYLVLLRFAQKGGGGAISWSRILFWGGTLCLGWYVTETTRGLCGCLLVTQRHRTDPHRPRWPLRPSAGSLQHQLYGQGNKLRTHPYG